MTIKEASNRWDGLFGIQCVSDNHKHAMKFQTNHISELMEKVMQSSTGILFNQQLALYREPRSFDDCSTRNFKSTNDQAIELLLSYSHAF